MKKLLILFTLLLSVILLVACGNTTPSQAGGDQSGTTTTQPGTSTSGSTTGGTSTSGSTTSGTTSGSQSGTEQGASTSSTDKYAPVYSLDQYDTLVNDVLNDSFLNGLNLNGKTINFYTASPDQDNPFNEKYHSDYVAKEKYEDFLTKLQQKYNFTLKFVPFSTSDKVTALKNDLLSNPDQASILRVNDRNDLASYIKAGIITTIDDIIKNTPDKYFQNEWQKTSGVLLGHNVGIQRFDGQLFPDLMVVNKGLLKEAGVPDNLMPDKLWTEGQWNLDNLKKIVTIASSHGDVFSGDKSVLGLTIYYIVNTIMKANGAQLIKDGQFNIEQYIPLIQKYINLVKGQNVAGRYLPQGYTEQTQYYNYPNQLTANFFKGNLAIGMIQNWQRGTANNLSDYIAIPIPTEEQNNETYIQSIEGGDVLSVTRGTNFQDVTKILLAIDRYNVLMDNNYLVYNVGHKQNSLPTTSKPSDVMFYLTYKWFKGVTQDDEDTVKKELNFIYGNYQQDGKSLAQLQSSTLASLGLSFPYSDAVLKAVMNNSDVSSAIQNVLPTMKKALADVTGALQASYDWEQQHSKQAAAQPAAGEQNKPAEGTQQNPAKPAAGEQNQPSQGSEQGGQGSKETPAQGGSTETTTPAQGSEQGEQGSKQAPAAGSQDKQTPAEGSSTQTTAPAQGGSDNAQK